MVCHILPGVDFIHQLHNKIIRVHLKEDILIGIQPHIQTYPGLFQISPGHALHILLNQPGGIIVGNHIYKQNRNHRGDNKGRHQTDANTFSIQLEFFHDKSPPFIIHGFSPQKIGEI